MKYPYNLITKTNCSIFGNFPKGKGVFFDLSDASSLHNLLNLGDQTELQKYAEQLMEKCQTNWGISSFGEYRQKMFTALGFKQMVDQKRFYHLGLDFWGPIGTAIYSPFDATIIQSQYESGNGNYGGMTVIQFNIDAKIYYAVFGHLDIDSLADVGIKVEKGMEIGRFGNIECNGGYFYHTHIQVLTQKGYDDGFAYQGYATKETWQNISEYCLDPTFLLFV